MDKIKKKNLVTAGIIIAVAVWLVVIGLFLSHNVINKKIDVQGTMTLTDADGYELTESSLNDSCFGVDGYDDISKGTQVTIKDGSGKTLSISRLEGGSVGGFGCAFNFNLKDVPKSDFYRIEVSHRGEVEYSHADLENKNFSVELSL